MNKQQAMFELARRKSIDDFWTYCLLINFSIFKSREEILKPIGESYQSAYEGNHPETYRIKVAVPRRTGKTYLTNAFIAWVISKNRDYTIMRATYNSGQATIIHNQVRAILESPMHRLIFPDLVLEECNATHLRLKGSSRINYKTTSVGSSATGSGANMIIGDDYYRDQTSAMSNVVNKSTINWYYSAFSSSLEGNNRIELCVGTRWRVGELSDLIDFDEEFVQPALLDDNTSFLEDVISTNELLKIQNKMEKSLFSAMYQQVPQLAKGSLFSPSDFDYIKGEVNDVIFRLSFSDNKTSGTDFYAMPILAVTKSYDVILEDVIYTNEVISDSLEYEVARLLNAYKVNECYFESNNDYSHKRNMMKLVNGKVYAKKTKLNKEVKLMVNARYVKNVKLRVTDDEEYNKYLNDLFKYDLEVKNQLDDAPDSLTMAVMQLMKKMKGKVLR